jgi:signal transduction histidine kinase/ActR/RegA family two-component response regulator
MAATRDNPDKEYSAVSMDRGLLGWVVRHGEAVLIGDLSQDPRHLRTAEGSQSVMAVPLKTAGSLAGVLLVESDKVNAFDQNELRLLQTLGGSLAAIVQNSSLLREVQEANERLQEVDRLKMNFLAAMSHELRTPLNSIIGFSRVILKGIDGPLTDMQEQDLTTIYDSGKHLLGLVNDILDQAKIEAGKMELSFAYFRLENVINGVMSTAVGLTRDKPIKLFTEIAENLPDAYGDEFRTRQVLLNLISNASKFTMEGSITITAFPINENGQDFIQVSVTDTGIGIAEEDMGLLFEAFQQVDNSTTRSVEGTGVGLPLAKSLTELQGGRIWVVSQPGAGSTFSVTIPMTPPPEETPEIQDELDAQVAELVRDEPLPPSQPRLILVVESKPEVVNLYRRYLSREGYEVLGTTQPQEALELAVVFQPCVVLLEVNLPDHDGWDLLSSLAGGVNTSHVPVIVCSMNANTERGFQLGAFDYLVKPFSEDQLLGSVRRSLESHPGDVQENN